MKYILSIDQGTTGTTSALIDVDKFSFVDKINIELPQIFPGPGQVEHDLNRIWSTVELSVQELLTKNSVSPNQIECIGITNQRETTCAFNGAGVPLYNGIVWQDRRTADYCNKKKSLGRLTRKLTGLPLDPYFSATKMRWLLSNVDIVSKAHKNNDLKFGTIDTFLLYKLTDGKSFKTDTSNASRTLLMDLKSCQWSNTLLDKFSISPANLPEICDSIGSFGVTRNLNFLPDGIPITGILGDQQAALFGQAGIHEGNLKCTYGTGAFLLLNTGKKIFRSKSGLLSTVAYSHNGTHYYALEGSSFIAGAAVQWLRDNLKIINSSSEIEHLASKVEDLNDLKDLLFLPFFAGIGSPHWKPNAKGLIYGITRDTDSHHIAHACLQGIAYSICDLVHAMRLDTKLPIDSLRVDGGACANNLLMSIQATALNSNVLRPTIIETTGYGAALAAGIGHSILDFEDIDNTWQLETTFQKSSHDESFYKMKYEQWCKLIDHTFMK